MADGKKSLLDQLLEEAMAKGAESAREDDFAVSLRNADGDQVDGIPVSQARGWLHEKFGIGEPPEAASGGGDGKEGAQGGAGQGKQPTTLQTFLTGKQRKDSAAS